MATLNRMVIVTLVTIASIFIRLECSNGRTVTLSHDTWRGVVGYIPVDRKAVQEKLDVYNIHQGSCGGPLLYLPENPVFPEILNETQHVVYIDFGTITQFDTEEFKTVEAHTYPSLSRPESFLLIPLLSNEPKGPAAFALVLDVFYPRNRSDLPNIGITFNYVPVDDVSISRTEAIVRDGNEEIRISIDIHDSPCTPAPSGISHELDEFLEDNSVLGFSQPDFSSCEGLQGNRFCSLVERIKDDVIFFAPNICFSSWGSPTSISCQARMEVLNITSEFRQRMLLGIDDPIHFIASESYNVYGATVVKFPCVKSEGYKKPLH
ncbi:hypothetical protein HOLleu_36894 [Holothuria leucospilota]|uniref:Uncharacterized protein n=1 Tax=Holothuria leucospilota TaxID=206669 RepID=A0A9Q0YRS8_HOLLE|nr:hypothetical protein HOLleu_36894 [Holothuria leucospilota]